MEMPCGIADGLAYRYIRPRSCKRTNASITASERGWSIVKYWWLQSNVGPIRFYIDSRNRAINAINAIKQSIQ